MGKRILILGASTFQLPLIERAKQEGHYVITSDYSPANPGHALADESHNVSTTDREQTLALAKALHIDAIATFASDPAVPAVAYVAEQLRLPGPSIESVQTLTQKDLFRKALKTIGLRTPNNWVVNAHAAEVPVQLKGSSQYLVKPTDSCGSKGVTLSSGNPREVLAAMALAAEYSRIGHIIIEDYIEGDQIHGDGFLVNGKLISCYLGDHAFFTKTNSFIPVSTIWPSRYTGPITNEIQRQVELVTATAGYMTGPVNIEARVTRDKKVYLIETAPRNGGNHVPIIQTRLTGFDYVKAQLDLAIGGSSQSPDTTGKKTTLAGAYFVLHSEENGAYAGMEIAPIARKHIFFFQTLKENGDSTEKYVGSHTAVGVALLEFDNIVQRDEIMGNIENLIRVRLKPQNTLVNL